MKNFVTALIVIILIIAVTVIVKRVRHTDSVENTNQEEVNADLNVNITPQGDTTAQ